MSVSFKYFFNSSKSLNELCKDVNAVLGCNLAPYKNDPEDLFCCFFSMEFSLWEEHGLENDRDVDFENYRFEIGIRIPAPDGNIRDLALTAMALVVAVLYRKLGVSGGILVFDVQLLLAKYVERSTSNGVMDLFDLVSERFVEFPDHISDLYRHGK